MRRALGFVAGVTATLAIVQPALAVTTTTLPTRTPSTSFAGYNLADYIGVPGAVSANIVVPPINCKGTPPAGSSIYAGVGIASVNSYARLFLGCTPRAKASYYPSLDVNGTIKNIPSHAIHSGDKVEFAVSQSVSQVTVSVIDLTSKFMATSNGSGGGTSEGITAGDYPGLSGGATSKVPNFGTLAFSSSLINGYPFGESPSAHLEVDDLYTGSVLQIKTSYSSTNKEEFVTVFHHS